MFVTFNRLVAAIALILTLAVAGCSSSGTAVSGYAGPSVSSATSKRTSARRDARAASRDVRVSRRAVRKIERSMKRDERRLKRKRGSVKRLKKAKRDLRANKRKLRTAKRDLRTAERRLKRAQRKERSADRAIRTARKRSAEAKRRFEDAEKRKRLAEARSQITRRDFDPERRSSIFAFGDPATKNIRDYQARVDGGFPVAAIPVNKMNTRLLRQEVAYSTRERPGTIVVDTGGRFLYLVKSGGKAMRYGIGVGRAGFAWSGSAHIGWKQEWPKWTPPDEMIERRPDLEKYSTENGGQPGGPSNPLGARALYLMKDGKDTLYRLHGTPQWASIGTAASSGCIRLMNQDIIDLYRRVPNGTKVVVI